MLTPNIHINDEFQKCFDLLETTPKNIFLTGKAGTGKSTFLQYFRSRTHKKTVVLAPTGVAALNVKGQTIHSFFNFRPDITLETVPEVRFPSKYKKIYRRLEMIIIDEVSMVRADLLDCIDAFLRLHGPDSKKPFGGIQMIFIGDLYQLPPVVRPDETKIFRTVYPSPYFFSARVLQEYLLDVVEFETPYRQQDEQFLEILNRIRTNQLEQHHLVTLNSRYQANMTPPENEMYIYLTTTNKLADKINNECLNNLKEELFTYEGSIDGDFDSKNLPNHQNLDLKIGAQVMLLNNDSDNRWINGSIGKVVDFLDVGYRNMVVQVELTDGKKVEVEPFTWEIFKFYYNEDTEAVDSQVVGSFRQFPIKLAWAVTIHKSQGKTFDRVLIDLGNGAFCHGQLYVALSRCRTLEGIMLKRPVYTRDVLVDPTIPKFFLESQYRQADSSLPLEARQALIAQAIAKQQEIEITYLKENLQRAKRRIIPKAIRSIEYKGEKGLGVEAFCIERQAHWIFRLNCIVEIGINCDSS
ncbi:MAG: AAA family ATPase [Candidatus Omnitrophica bacterium]|nr:AAA family ATPase [Candidatus Omnitrophota bacterium]